MTLAAAFYVIACIAGAGAGILLPSQRLARPSLSFCLVILVMLLSCATFLWLVAAPH